MKILYSLLLAVVVFLGLRHVSNRHSLHKKVLPSLASRVNTQVHRINQR